MAKKKFKFNLKVSYDAPVTLTFVFVCVIIFLLQLIFSKLGKNIALNKVFLSPTTASGSLPFIVKEPLSYLRLLFYIFGNGLLTSSANGASVLFTNLLILLLMGSSMEERYGSVIIGIMIFVSALFSGVLNACFCEESLVGAFPVASMMIFLTAFIAFSKKTIPLTFVTVFIFFGFYVYSSGIGLIKLIICVAGGLCGSLFAFLTSPKVKAEKKSGKSSGAGSKGSGGGLLSRAEKLAYAEELDKNSPRNKKAVEDSDESDDDTTVVGTLKF